MEIYVDLRCFQDPGYAFRGVGYHSSTLLREGRKYFSQDSRWIGVVDSSMSKIPQEYSDLVDEFASVAAPSNLRGTGLFIQLSPMTHNAELVHRFLGQAHTLSAAVVYDFIPLDLPERYLTNQKLATEYASNLTWLRKYDLLFPISEYSASRLLDLFDFPRSEVHVTGVALRQEFQSILQQESTVALKTAGPKRAYFLFVGGADSRKNVNVVLASHAQLNMVSKPQLMIVGAYPQKFYDEMIAFYRSHGGNSGDIVWKQGIGDCELAALYRDCLCSICSSEIEGFSLPVIEAIASGASVFVSNIAAHRELVSDHESVFEPHDAVRLGQLMQRAIDDKGWRQNLAHSQAPVAKRFLLERVAYRFWHPIAQSQKFFQEKKAIVSGGSRRARIAILSPFPPDRSGVADYTRRSLEEIGKLADIDVFCDTTNPIATSGVQHFFPLSTLPHLANQYDQVVSVIGNSHFHAKILDYQVRFGGPCLVHDNRLAELYHWWKGPEAFREMACRSLRRNVSFAECQDWLRDPGKLPSIFFDELISSAKPLMVHSRGIQAHVKKQYGTESIHLPFCVYRDFPDEWLSRSSKRFARQKLGISEDVFAIVSLGIVDPTKSPDICIQAIAIARQSGLNAHLYFVGSSKGQQQYVFECARQSKVSDAVHLCGDWVDEQMYSDFIVAADMAIQLRKHFFGGLSGAMLDCIASGLVTIANEDLAEAMDSPTSVLRISDKLLSSELTKQIIKVKASFDLNDRLTEGRDRYLVEHSFSTYARQFMDALA